MKRLLMSCRQGAGMSIMDLQDPRGQVDAATMLNGKGRGRQELPRPQWGDLCQGKELVVGLQPPWGNKVMDNLWLRRRSTLEIVPSCTIFHFCFFVPSRGYPLINPHLLPLARVDFCCLPLRIRMDALCLHIYIHYPMWFMQQTQWSDNPLHTNPQEEGKTWRLQDSYCRHHQQPARVPSILRFTCQKLLPRTPLPAGLSGPGYIAG